MSSFSGPSTVMRGALGNTLDTPDKRVFTVFCHGTGGHRDGKCEELITEFGGAYWFEGDSASRPVLMKPDGSGVESFASNRATANTFYRDHYQKDFLILDGVGTCDMSKGVTRTPRYRRWMSVTAEIGTAGAPNPMPGDFNPFDPDKPIKRNDASLPGILATKVSTLGAGIPGKHRGDIDGDGWNDNIAHALWVLKKLREADVDNPDSETKYFPKVINAIGWSRGAVTTIKLAYWVHKYFVLGEDFKVAKGYFSADQGTMITYLPRLEADYLVPEAEIEMNVFAIDPVPGRAGKSGEWGGAKRSLERFPTSQADQDYRSIAPIVNNCIITLATDERREGFYPLDAETQDDGAPHVTYDAAKSNVVWLPYPGIHRTQLRLSARDPFESVDKNMRLPGESVKDAVARIKGELTALPRLVWDLAWKFLLFHGTEFRRDLAPTWGGPLDPETICTLFDEVGKKRDLYHTGRNRGLKQRGQGGLKYRGFTGYPRSDRPIAFDDLFSPKLGDYVRGRPTQFLNEHHRAVLMFADPVEYRRRQSSATYKPFVLARRGVQNWTVNPLYEAPEHESQNALYEVPEPQAENPVNGAEELEAEPVVDEGGPATNTPPDQGGGIDPDDALPAENEEDVPDPPGSIFPRQPSVATTEAIFRGKLETMQRSRRFDARYRPVSGHAQRTADNALFIELLARAPEGVVD